MNRVPAYVAKYDREPLIILIVKEGVNRLDGIKSGRNFAPSFGNDGRTEEEELESNYPTAKGKKMYPQFSSSTK